MEKNIYYKLWDNKEKVYFSILKGEKAHYYNIKAAEKAKEDYLAAGNYPNDPHTVIQIHEFETTCSVTDVTNADRRLVKLSDLLLLDIDKQALNYMNSENRSPSIKGTYIAGIDYALDEIASKLLILIVDYSKWYPMRAAETKEQYVSRFLLNYIQNIRDEKAK